MHGRYPDALSALVPDVIPALPTTPFDTAGLVYRLPADGDDLGGRAYLLYSIGADGIDNGGTRDPKDPLSALSNEDGSGYDYIFGG